jgi:periplasmic divalent cation tolerance protein
MSDVVLVLTTVPAGEAGETIARRLIEERLAACVSVHAPMTSVYRWEGVVTADQERQLVIKTIAERLPALRERLGQLHSYTLPELLVLAVQDGSPAYLDWVRTETGRP